MSPGQSAFRVERPSSLSKDERFKPRFLQAFDQWGAGYLTAKDFADAFGFSYSYLRNCRSEDSAFAAACDRIEAKHRKLSEKPLMAPVFARERHPDLDFWKALFLEFFRETAQIIESCRLAGRTWKNVQAELDDDPVFKARYQDILQEHHAAVEDARLREALRGRSAAAKQVLESIQNGDSSGRQGSGNSVEPTEPAPGDFGDTESTRAFYRSLFSRHEALGEQQRAGLERREPGPAPAAHTRPDGGSTPPPATTRAHSAAAVAAFEVEAPSPLLDVLDFDEINPELASD